MTDGGAKTTNAQQVLVIYQVQSIIEIVLWYVITVSDIMG